MAENLVEPRAGVTPTPAENAPTAPETTDSASSELPDELLKIPAMQGVLSGAPGAFSAVLSEFDKDPAAKIIVANKDPLMKAGVNFYRSLDGAKGVVFNALKISGEQLKAADQAGQLGAVAPPFAEVNGAIAKSGAENPVLAAGGPPIAAEGEPMPKPLGAGASEVLATKRANNLKPGAPTSGPVPGAGRLLSTILKPVV